MRGAARTGCQESQQLIALKTPFSRAAPSLVQSKHVDYSASDVSRSIFCAGRLSVGKSAPGSCILQANMSQKRVADTDFLCHFALQLAPTQGDVLQSTARSDS
jgi:hypothetical protein